MNKRIQKKRDKLAPKIYVNDKRYFKPDDISRGLIMAYAVWIPAERERVRA